MWVGVVEVICIVVVSVILLVEFDFELSLVIVWKS